MTKICFSLIDKNYAKGYVTTCISPRGDCFCHSVKRMDDGKKTLPFLSKVMIDEPIDCPFLLTNGK